MPAIAIPTRDRPRGLARLLDSIARQTMLPERIVIVDDNGAQALDQRHQAGSSFPQVILPRLGVPIDIIRGPRRGPGRAHQRALEFLARSGCAPELVLRLDDDLVLESRDFIERLWRVMAERPEVGAAGGVFPERQRAEPVVIERIGGVGYSLTIAGMLRGEDSAQFFRWSQARIVEVEHLYSSFVYRLEAAVAVGGFATWYSDQAHREETDFTHRLHLAGWKLVVDTGAVAVHDRCPYGGVRGVAREGLRWADEALFIERLTSGAMKRCASPS